MTHNLFDIKNTMLPKDTKEALNSITKNPEKIDNFALQFYKCANFLNEKDWTTFDHENTNKKLKAFFYKSKFKNSTRGEYQEFKLNPQFNEKLLNEVKCKIRKLVNNICTEVEILPNISISWRLALGLGNASVFENGITLHHVYGFPYLPASSIKGMTHHWLLDQIANLKQLTPSSDQIASLEEKIRLIFGTEEQIGRIMFFDAYPDRLENGFSSESSLQPDIINNHYQPYYEGNKPPADYHSPNPVFFLTLKNVKFSYYLGLKDSNTEENKDLLKYVKNALIQALIQKGIGAKTAVGYGYFNKPS